MICQLLWQNIKGKIPEFIHFLDKNCNFITGKWQIRQKIGRY